MAHFTGKRFMTAIEHVILVDEYDNELGVAEKLQAHREGRCHRAFSIFVMRQQPQLELLLQQRASEKYHSPNLWTNTCCSHPRPGEDMITAGQRRLKEEMGIDITLKSIGHFHYIAHFENGLIENEFDHVLVGEYNNEKIVLNKEEVQNYRWISISELKKELQQHPQIFTLWLKQALEKVEKWL